MLNEYLHIYKRSITTWLQNDYIILDIIIQFGPQELKNELIRVIKKEVEEENGSYIYTLIKDSASWRIQDMFYEFFLKRINKLFSIDIDLFLASDYKIQEIDWPKNIEAMTVLENAIPGSVKKLSTEYGIHEFYRYPIEMLIDQINEENIDRPYNIIIYPYGDHNQAFDQEVEIFRNLYNSSKKDFAFKIFEAGSTHQVMEYLIMLKRRYKDNKISNIVLGGHGQKDALYLNSPDFSNNDNSSINQILLSKRIKTIQFISKFFESKGAIALLSCSTGSRHGLAHMLSDITKLRVIAPTVDTSIAGLEIQDGVIVPTFSSLNSTADFKPKTR